MRKALKKWWDGEFVPYENEPSDSVVIIGGTTKRHWTSSVANAVWAFLRNEWKWAIGTGIAVIGLTMTYIRFF